MTATEKRKLVRAKYSEIIGRNSYSQAKRDYCYKKYKDGKYYSDCSSSVSYAYKEAGFGFGILNTAGMYNCAKFTQVPVKIEKGQILNPEILRIGDMLLYAGTDGKRPGCVGHVEMYWGYDAKGVHWLYGHGSGKPKKTRMTEKNRSRYAAKTGTKVGNKGLIRVVRFIQDDGAETDGDAENVKTENGTSVNAGTYYLRVGPGTEYESCGVVHGGSAIEVAAQLVGNDDWYFVKCEGKAGFIGKSGVKL